MATSQSTAPPQEMDIPNWLSRHVDTWIKIPCVKAVVLFGSRAIGDTWDGSDWDLAVVHEGSEMEDVPKGRDFYEQPVDLAYLPLKKYRSKAHQVGTLAHELATHGRLIKGHLPALQKRRLVVSEEELVRHLFYATHNLASAIGDIQTDISHGDPEESLDSILAYVSSPSSANGAERTAKALCVHLGITYSHTHDVEKLSELVPKEWRAKVLAMDGDTSKAHVATYEGSFEWVSDTVRRVSVSLSLLNELLLPCIEQLSMTTLGDLNKLVTSDSAMEKALSYLETASAYPSVVELVQEIKKVIASLNRHVVERERSLERDKGYE